MWFRLPEVAVIVAVYVPAGVPEVEVVEVEDVDDEVPLDPHPRENVKSNTMMGARTGSRLRLRTANHADARNTSVQARGTGPHGKVT